jgi:hypothetical protein
LVSRKGRKDFKESSFVGTGISRSARQLNALRAQWFDT